MEQILKELGLEDLLSNFVENKVSEKEILTLSDEEFCLLGVTSIGDRARLRLRCRMYMNDSVRDSPVVLRFRELQQTRQTVQNFEVGKNKKKAKLTRKIYVGWKHKKSSKMGFQSIPANKGGGVAHVDLDKQSTVKILEEEICKIFFPDGRSNAQELDLKDLDIFVASFSGKPLEQFLTYDTFSLEHFCNDIGVSPIRIYLHTCVKDQEDMPEEGMDEQLSENILDPVDLLDPVDGTANSGTPTVVFTRGRRHLLNVDTLPDLTFESLSTPSSTSCLDVGTASGDVQLQRPAISPPDSATVNLQQGLYKETLRETLQRFDGNIISSPKNNFNIDRTDVLDGGYRGFMRSTFNPWAKLSVRFVDEDGIDDGGPMREFLRLAMKAASEMAVFSDGMLILDYNAMNKKQYLFVGKLFAYSIVHRGPSPCFLSPLLYSMLAIGTENVTPIITDITDQEIKSKIQEIDDCSDMDSYMAAVQNAEDLIALAGCTFLSLRYTQEHQKSLVYALVRFITVDRLTPAFNQFVQGLQSMGIVDKIRENSESWREVFTSIELPLDVTQVEGVFEVVWSEPGSNRRRRENRVVTYWRDLLQDLSEGLPGPICGRQLGLADVLIFSTGADSIPVLGFDKSPSLSFLHTEDIENTYMEGMPRANTCSMVLRLPILETYDSFKANMLASIEMVTTFTDH